MYKTHSTQQQKTFQNEHSSNSKKFGFVQIKFQTNYNIELEWEMSCRSGSSLAYANVAREIVNHALMITGMCL